jgi:hypothetical protein
MLIPEFIYGLSKEARAASRAIASKLKAGAAWGEAVPDATAETSSRPGLLVLHGPSPLLGGQKHFHVYALLDEIFAAKAPEEIRESAFGECLRTAWGTLSLVSFKNQVWLYPAGRHVPFLRAVLSRWDEFDAEGARYSFGTPDGARLWDIHSNLKYVLARMGIPPEALRQPLPEGGLAALVARHDLRL